MLMNGKASKLSEQLPLAAARSDYNIDKSSSRLYSGNVNDRSFAPDETSQPLNIPYGKNPDDVISSCKIQDTSNYINPHPMATNGIKFTNNEQINNKQPSRSLMSTLPTSFSISSTSENSRSVNQIEFGDIPVECRCFFCKKNICTQVEFHASWVTYLLSFLVICIFGWISICVLPFLWPLFQDAVHTCPKCLNVMKRKQRISIPSIRNEVITIKCGNCAIVLSRKYVVALFFMLSTIFIVYILRLYVTFIQTSDWHKGEKVEATWEEFLIKCANRNSIGNSLNAAKNFDEHFKQKTVQWRGSVHNIYGSMWNNIMEIDMNPPSGKSLSVPDLALIFFEQMNAKVADLHVGDIINFEATLTEYGKRGNPHFGILWNFTRIHKYDEIPELDTMDPTKGLLSPLFLMNHLSSIMERSGMTGAGRVVIIGNSPVLYSRLNNFNDHFDKNNTEVVSYENEFIIPVTTENSTDNVYDLELIS